MNFRNKYLVIVIRTLFGLALLLVGALGLFMDVPEGLSAPAAAALQGLSDLGIAKLIAVVEIAAGS